jgi:hypothetical protein
MCLWHWYESLAFPSDESSNQQELKCLHELKVPFETKKETKLGRQQLSKEHLNHLKSKNQRVAAIISVWTPSEQVTNLRIGKLMHRSTRGNTEVSPNIWNRAEVEFLQKKSKSKQKN